MNKSVQWNAHGGVWNCVENQNSTQLQRDGDVPSVVSTLLWTGHIGRKLWVAE